MMMVVVFELLQNVSVNTTVCEDCNYLRKTGCEKAAPTRGVLPSTSSLLENSRGLRLGM